VTRVACAPRSASAKRLTFADGGQLNCDGMTVVVNLADPSCATQNSTNCIAGDAGECP